LEEGRRGLAGNELTPPVDPTSPYDAKARIYGLADPADIIAERGQVERAFFQALGVAPSDGHRLTISQSSGWFDYVATGELWDRPTAPTLPDQAAALKAAEGVLGAIQGKCSVANAAWPERLQDIALLPPVGLLRRAGLYAVQRPEANGWDHWLYRAEPQLLLDGGAITRAGVFGAQVEVRIGHLGQVIDIRSRWRPLSGERILTDFRPFRSDDPQGQSGEKQPPLINFLLEGDGIPQYYLAPYYFQTDGHDINMTSASNWSLTVDVGRTRQQQERMTLTALAQGGSGDYLYNWAMYSVEDFAEGLRELGTGVSEVVSTGDGRANASSVELDNGHAIILLNVKDKATGAFKHHQQQIFSSAFLS
jgi:hypothetical protein